jgi:hypothetical protein
MIYSYLKKKDQYWVIFAMMTLMFFTIDMLHPLSSPATPILDGLAMLGDLFIMIYCYYKATMMKKLY